MLPHAAGNRRNLQIAARGNNNTECRGAAKRLFVVVRIVLVGVAFVVIRIDVAAASPVIAVIAVIAIVFVAIAALHGKYASCRDGPGHPTSRPEKDAIETLVGGSIGGRRPKSGLAPTLPRQLRRGFHEERPPGRRAQARTCCEREPCRRRGLRPVNTLDEER